MRWSAVLVTLAFATQARADELELSEVLQSVERHHPKVAAAMAYEDVARGELFASRGAFDPYLSAYGAIRSGGYYELRRLDVELRQPTPLWGAELWAGYRIGRGVDSEQRYPTYYDDETASGGELRAGLRIPLWRDRALDSRRAGRMRAQTRVDAAEQARSSTVIELKGKATEAYMAWLAAGRRHRVASELLELASQRQTWVVRRAEEGATAEIDVIEAQRAVLSRRQALVSASRQVEAMSYVLALFHRSSEGTPLVATLDELPADVPAPPIPEPSPEMAFEQAVVCQPALERARAELEALRVDRSLASAQRAPRVDVQGQVSRDLGTGDSTLTGTVLEAGLVLSMPLGLRAPRGELQAANARIESAEQDLRLMEDQLRAWLLDAASAHRAAQQRRELASQLLENMQRLAQAERARFEAGATELFMVNQREQALAQAAVAEVDAARDEWKAVAQWVALTSCEL